MNKKFFLLGAGALATAGFLTLTAFGGMTKAQQDAGIADKVTAALAELKTAKAKECEDKVAVAANVKAQEMLAAPAAAPTIGGKGGPSKKPNKKGQKDPVPSAPSVPPATAPSKTQPESQSKWNQGGEQKTQESKSKWAEPAPAGTAPAPAKPQESKSKWDKKKEGGGK